MGTYTQFNAISHNSVESHHKTRRTFGFIAGQQPLHASKTQASLVTPLNSEEIGGRKNLVTLLLLLTEKWRILRRWQMTLSSDWYATTHIDARRRSLPLHTPGIWNWHFSSICFAKFNLVTFFFAGSFLKVSQSHDLLLKGGYSTRCHWMFKVYIPTTNSLVSNVDGFISISTS